MKMRKGLSNEQLGQHFKLTKVTIKTRLDVARKCLMEDFVPIYLRNRSREEMIRSNTPMAQKLLAPNNPNKVIRVWDGTYVYIDKSANIEFQKKTYSGQKKRNFLRFMMSVAPDGYIEQVYGPVEANMNDAKMLEGILENHYDDLNLEEGDVMVIDRGFRDCVKTLIERGFEVRIPEFLDSNGVFSTEQANSTRFCTKIRFVVETKNGHIKQFFGAFDQVWCSYSMTHIGQDFRICVALLNKFSKPVVSDKDMVDEIATRMLRMFDQPNILSEITRKNNFQKQVHKFSQCRDFSRFPTLRPEDLVLFACGTYQLRLAPSYYNEHIKANGDQFVVFACPDDICHTFCQSFYTATNDPKLLLVEFSSRYRSNQKHHAYVLIDTSTSSEGIEVILGHCCSCENGRRTVGSCVHIICVLWFVTYARQGDIKIPAHFLNDFFDSEI